MGPRTTLGVYLKAISSSGSLLLLLLLHFHEGIIAGASAASVSSMEQKCCDKVVAVEHPELLSYLGNVTFTVPAPFRGRWTAIIKFTSPYTFIGGWGVEVQSYGLKAYAIFKRNEDVNLKLGDEVIFQFRVLYGLNAKVPKVLWIRWEDRSICGPIMLSPSLITQENERELSIEESDGESGNSSEDGGSSENNQQHITTNNVRLTEIVH